MATFVWKADVIRDKMNNEEIIVDGPDGVSQMSGNGNLSLAWRKASAIIICSVVASLSTLTPFAIAKIFHGGFPISQIFQAYGFLLMFVVPIAAAGIIIFGLPLLSFVRYLGLISTPRQLIEFGAVAGATWGAIAHWILGFRVEALLMTIPLGGFNGIIVAVLWLGIVHKFRLSQSHDVLVGHDI